MSPLGRIMYPGDEGADDPADVRNCRCSMIYEHPEYPSHIERRDAETGEIVGDMTYEEWAEMKAERAEEASASQPAAASNKDQPSGKTGLTGSGKDGTIKTQRTETSLNNAISPMPSEQLDRIRNRFIENGGVMQMDKGTDRYLEMVRHANGITYDASTIVLHTNPSRATVFEELIHSWQHRTGRIPADLEVDTPRSNYIICQCEIEAKTKLLKYAKAYKLTDTEIAETRELLEADRRNMQYWERRMHDESV